jgi:hypothetical protein
MSKLSYYLEMASKIRPIQAAPKVLNYIKYKTQKREAVHDIANFTPQIASLFLTARCNLACDFCNTGKPMKAGRPVWRAKEADLSKVKEIFKNPLFANCLLVDLLGGEPLLVKELDKIVAFLAGRGHITNTSTNGWFLMDRIKDLKTAGITRINVSLYEENRAVLERDLASINQIFPVHTSLVLQKTMLETQAEYWMGYIRLVREAGCRSLRFWIYRPMGLNPDDKEIVMDDDPAYLEFRRTVEEKYPGLCLWPEPVRAGPVRKLCPQLWQRISCDMQGNLGICCGTDESLPSPNNNLFDAAPDVIFNHPTLVSMRSQLIDPNVQAPEMCRHCNLLGEAGW